MSDSEHLASVIDTVKATGGAVEIRGVRIEPCDEYGATDTTRLVDSLRRQLRDVEARLRWHLGRPS